MLSMKRIKVFFLFPFFYVIFYAHFFFLDHSFRFFLEKEAFLPTVFDDDEEQGQKQCNFPKLSSKKKNGKRGP